MQPFQSAHFNHYELTLTSEERGSFFIPFFLCFYTSVKVRAIKLYSLHMISWSEAQKRNRLTRQNVIPKAGCWGERGEETLRCHFFRWNIMLGRHSALAEYLLLTFNDPDFDQASSDLQHWSTHGAFSGTLKLKVVTVWRMKWQSGS